MQMGTLHKYIFKQVFGAAFMTVALFVFVLVVGNVVKEVMGDLTAGRLDFWLFVKIILLIIPGVIPYALPLGMLTGILLVFGRMSAQSEIVAIKASGRSIYDIAAPVFFLSIIASLFSVAINFYYAPLADYTYKATLKNVIRENPLQFIRPGFFIRDFPGYVIYANSADGDILKEFRIWELNKDGEVSVATQARTAKITYDEPNEEIVLTLYNASADYRKKGDAEDFSKPVYTSKFEEASVKLRLSDIIGSFKMTKYKLSLLTFGELMNARYTWRKNPNLPETPELAYQNRIAVQTQIQKNFAMAFSIFSMVVLAIPLGIKASRTETFANLGIALALALSYYLMTVVITWLENFPHMRPDILIWIPNLLFIALGSVLMVRASRN